VPAQAVDRHQYLHCQPEQRARRHGTEIEARRRRSGMRLLTRCSTSRVRAFGGTLYSTGCTQVMHRKKNQCSMLQLGHFDRSGQSCLAVHVRAAPKPDQRLGATCERRIDAGGTTVMGSFESCAMNLPTTNGLPSSRCCRTSLVASTGERPPCSLRLRPARRTTIDLHAGFYLA
jgi:hypothetical protein